MPLDVEDPVGCRARNGGKNAATVCPGRTCQTRISAHILPEREDGEVKRALKQGGWKTLSAVAAWFVDAHELQPSIGTDVRAVESLTIQLEVEWQRDERIAVIAVIAAVGRAWHYRIGTWIIVYWSLGQGADDSLLVNASCWDVPLMATRPSHHEETCLAAIAEP